MTFAIPLVGLLAAGSAVAGVVEGAAASRQQSRALAAQQQAQQAQERASRAAEEDAQLQATGQSAAQRIARAAGKRVLAFQGDSLPAGGGALASTLGDTTKVPGATLGG